VEKQVSVYSYPRVFKRLTTQSQRHESLLSVMNDISRARPNETYDRIGSTIDLRQRTGSISPRGSVGVRKGALTSTCYEFHLSFGIVRIRVSNRSMTRRSTINNHRNDLRTVTNHRRVVASFVPGYFLSSVLECTLSRGYSPWSLVFKMPNLRPDWSPIFKYCCSGDIPAIQKLFEDGLASPTDTNSEGMTPLHVRILTGVRFYVHLTPTHCLCSMPLLFTTPSCAICLSSWGRQQTPAPIDSSRH
jgi:hypothetical protein